LRYGKRIIAVAQADFCATASGGQKTRRSFALSKKKKPRISLATERRAFLDALLVQNNQLKAQ